VNELRVIPLPSVAMVKEGDDLVAMFLEALDASGLSLEHRDLVIVTSKVVSKSEGQVVDFDGTEEHKASLIEGESARILRRRGPLRITETHHGFINANAGIDLSNTDDGTAVLLPKDPDRSARRFRAEIQRRCSVEVAVIITDTFGRVWRVGVTDVAIRFGRRETGTGSSGTNDATGRVLEVTEVAIADEIASAANLVLGKAEATPFAILRGLDDAYFGDGSIKEDALRRLNEDLFR